MTLHVIRLIYQQPFFGTPTVGHVKVGAKDAASAVSAIERYYRDYRVRVEFIATLPR